VIIKPGFFDWIARKYRTAGQKHRRFPPLVFFLATFPHAFRSSPPANVTHVTNIKTITIHNIDTRHYLNHLNQNLFFNINFVARIARKSQELFKTLLKMVEAILPALPTLNEGTGRTKTPGKIALTFSAFSAIASPGVTISQHRWKTIHQPGEKSPITVIPPFPPPRFTPSSPVDPAESYRSYESQTAPPVTQNHGKTQPETEPAPDVHNVHNSHSIQHSHNTLNGNIYPSVAVLNPLPSSAAFTPTSISNNFNTAPLFVTRFMNSSHIPGQSDIPRTETPERQKGGTLSKSAPTLEYSNSFRVALEDVKNTVTHVEKKVNEEITEIKKTHPVEKTAAVNGTGISSKTNADIGQLTDRVYRMLEKKIRIEKERRGW